MSSACVVLGARSVCLCDPFDSMYVWDAMQGCQWAPHTMGSNKAKDPRKLWESVGVPCVSSAMCTHIPSHRRPPTTAARGLRRYGRKGNKRQRGPRRRCQSNARKTLGIRMSPVSKAAIDSRKGLTHNVHRLNNDRCRRRFGKADGGRRSTRSAATPHKHKKFDTY